MQVKCLWEVKEKQASGIYVPVLSRHNIFTAYGLTALAEAVGGQPYVAPQYLEYENNGTGITNVGGIAASATSCTAAANILLGGDTTLILGVGTANQETVTGVTVTGTGPYTYHFTASTKSHAQNDPICRVPLQTDLVANLQSEQQYDSTNNPNQRMLSAAGFSTGTGVWVIQFYYNGAQAITGAVGNFTTVGLCDSITVGGGNLHDHVALGYVHTSGNDLEIDVTITLAN